MLYDLHLHSAYSDGDLPPAAVVRAAKERGVGGVSLTDHNGIWGVDKARVAAAQRGVRWVEGIEVSARAAGWDVHLLGFSRDFDRGVLREGLRETLAGYEVRMREMVARCQAAGYNRVTVPAVKRRRAGQSSPCYLSYDVACVLVSEHGLTAEAARRLTTGAGVCAVPYGDWALTAAAAMRLIAAAGGVAVWAHPGLVLRDAGEQVFVRVWKLMAAAGVAGLEVYHPYHDAALRQRFAALAAAQDLLVTGGSDWHGKQRYAKTDEAFGKVGVGEEEFERLLVRMEERKSYGAKRNRSVSRMTNSQ